ncbi:MAG: hypothetical protein HYW05_01270 [Candidatus Diapherotrites archaeon]|nr:hypothetical protein [Candidatus Diapherotrites archaeon]
MGTIEEHIGSSIRRTGNSHRALHEWLDGKDLSYGEMLSRHAPSNVQKFLPLVRKKFGKEGAGEYLRHLHEDYEHGFLLRAVMKMEKLWLWCLHDKIII